MRQGARGWCTGMTLSDRMGREVGGDSGGGTHVCTPMADSCQCSERVYNEHTQNLYLTRLKKKTHNYDNPKLKK